MKGNIKVVVSTKKLRYELNLRRNITIIQGDSATGKTTLIQIINDYLSSRTGPGTDVICKKKCAVLSGDLESVLIRLERLSDTIVFANEQEHFLYPKRFAAAVLKSDCYFVFITRDDLHTLPYSVNEIYCLKNSGYYQNTRQVYNSCLLYTSRAHVFRSSAPEDASVPPPVPAVPCNRRRSSQTTYIQVLPSTPSVRTPDCMGSPRYAYADT